MPSIKPLPDKPLSTPNAPCPCGSHTLLKDCCLPFIEGKCNAPTAEALMRSRYTAHKLLAIDYLWKTWSPEQRIRSSKEEIHQWAASCDWLQLQILHTQKGKPGDTEGIVEFVALFRQGGQLQEHHEVSVFQCVMGNWLYVDHQ